MAQAKSHAQVALEHAPWKPAAYDDREVFAIQALARGTANGEQQKLALAWIIEKACATYDLAFRPGGVEGERDTLIALGRQIVGQQIVKLTKLKVGQLRREAT